MLRLGLIQKHLAGSEMSSEKLNFKETRGTYEDRDLLFDPELLKGLEWHEKKSSYKGDIDYLYPSDGLILRPLHIQDYDKGFLSTLSQLTEVGEISREQFEARFRGMQSCSGTYYVVVVEDTKKSRVVGCTTLMVEQKFIHQTATRGRIEDVVVSEECRGKQLGKLFQILRLKWLTCSLYLYNGMHRLVDVLVLLGKKLGCYKISLECKDNNVKFYQSLGFSLDEQHFMTLRFKH